MEFTCYNHLTHARLHDLPMHDISKVFEDIVEYEDKVPNGFVRINGIKDRTRFTAKPFSKTYCAKLSKPLHEFLLEDKKNRGWVLFENITERGINFVVPSIGEDLCLPQFGNTSDGFTTEYMVCGVSLSKLLAILGEEYEEPNKFA